MHVVIICCPACDDMNFGSNLGLLNKPFFYMTKKSDKNGNIAKTEKVFTMK